MKYIYVVKENKDPDVTESFIQKMTGPHEPGTVIALTGKEYTMMRNMQAINITDPEAPIGLPVVEKIG